MKSLSDAKCLFDSNILVYAAIVGSPHHLKSRELFELVKSGDLAGAVCPQVLLEFSAVMRNSCRLAGKPLSEATNAYFSDERLPCVYPDSTTVEKFIDLLKINRQIYAADLFLAATAISSDYDTVITNDRDFGKIKGVKVYNPFT